MWLMTLVVVVYAILVAFMHPKLRLRFYVSHTTGSGEADAFDISDFFDIFYVKSETSTNMATNYKLSPPKFGGKSYELYKIQLKAWKEITDVANEKQGIFIALSLPDQDETKIKEKVFEQLGVDNLKVAGGLDALITFMDKFLEKDSLEDA